MRESVSIYSMHLASGLADPTYLLTGLAVDTSLMKWHQCGGTSSNVSAYLSTVFWNGGFLSQVRILEKNQILWPTNRNMYQCWGWWRTAKCFEVLPDLQISQWSIITNMTNGTCPWWWTPVSHKLKTDVPASLRRFSLFSVSHLVQTEFLLWKTVWCRPKSLCHSTYCTLKLCCLHRI